ncbi:MAG: hypothetical protein KKD59_09795 [Acidobacteria bacterium]|nr:hypothetical protein [Acidobacteriota bacterium]MBU4329105.1 hypothetical protein [Acidobacteriota bacterium]
MIYAHFPFHLNNGPEFMAIAVGKGYCESIDGDADFEGDLEPAHVVDGFAGMECRPLFAFPAGLE